MVESGKEPKIYSYDSFTKILFLKLEDPKNVSEDTRKIHLNHKLFENFEKARKIA